MLNTELRDPVAGQNSETNIKHRSRDEVERITTTPSLANNAKFGLQRSMFYIDRLKGVSFHSL